MNDEACPVDSRPWLRRGAGWLGEGASTVERLAWVAARQAARLERVAQRISAEASRLERRARALAGADRAED